ncbi:MAG TPA: molybdopterin cofactor-binding domain-containing protein [Pirellulaceae bacterium]
MKASPPEPRTLNPEPSLEPERYELHEPLRFHFDLDRRDILKTLGGGVLISLVPAHVQAQQKGQRGRGGTENRPQQIGGWLHIAEDGQISLYCGKTEVGQNVRTSVTQAAAEELRVKPEAIRVILADTKLVPDDGGTSGSQSTPRTVPQIRRVGAAARELLLDLAAEQLKVDRATLTIENGQVNHPPSSRKLTYGDLTKGQKLTKEVSGSISVTPTEKWQVLGTSTPKATARAIVTGVHRFASDIQLDGMLFGKVLRPKSLDAKLLSLDTKEAEALPGVIVVRDGNFVGIAAPTSFEAEQALAKIKAEWSPSDHQSTHKTIFDDLKRSGRGSGINEALEAALKAADHRLDATYNIAYIAHAPLEPRVGVAQWQDGKLTVWTGTQQPFRVRSDLARAFNLADDKVRVIVPDAGAGYGGKHTVDTTIEAARLAKAAGKPVKIVWTREEEFTWAYFRPAGVIDVRAGMTKGGKLTAWDFHNYNSGQSAVRALYDIPQQRSEFHQSNSPLKQGSYRALASTANNFARESHINELATIAGIDPLAFRLKNLKDERLRAVLEAAASQFGWQTLTRSVSEGQKHRGYGLAGGSEKGSYVATCAEIAVDPSTNKVRVIRTVTAFECGTVLHPDNLKNQIEGAVIQGIGGALFEEIEFDRGQIQNARFSDYRVPRFRDTPQLETVLVNRPDLAPIGAGETPIIAIAPAIAAAVFQATGIRPRSLPMSTSGVKV